MKNEKTIDELFVEMKKLKEQYLASDDVTEKLNLFKRYNNMVSQILEIERSI